MEMDWHLHVDVVLLLCLGFAAYLYSLVKLQPAPRWLHPIERRHLAWFGLGVTVIFLAEGTPIHDLSEQYSFSVHMTQHMLIGLVAPPLFLLGIPKWYFTPLLKKRAVLSVAKVLTSPVIGVIGFNAMLAVWHLPSLYEAALQDHNIHILSHALYLGTAFLMWWPIFGSAPELPRLAYPAQMLYLFVQSLVPAVLAAIITFSDEVVYATYANAPQILAWSAVEDQQIGGLIMKFVGSAIMWGVATVIFFTWFRQEETEVEKSWD